VRESVCESGGVRECVREGGVRECVRERNFKRVHDFS